MDEHQRLQALQRYAVMDTAPEFQFDDFVALAAAICQAPISAITLLDGKRQWFKAKTGIALEETPREIAFCATTVQEGTLFMVPDAAADGRFADNPLVCKAPFVRFYAGAPLRTAEGLVLGTLAVMDHVPRTLSQAQQQALQVLADNVMARLELRRQMRSLQQSPGQEEAEEAYQTLLHRHLPEADVLEQAVALLPAQPEEWHRQSALLQSFIDSLPGIFYVFDPQGRLLRWNARLEEVSGYEAADIGRRKWRDFFARGGDQAAIRQLAGQVLTEGQGEIEADLLARDGRRLPYYFNGKRIALRGETVICGMGLDIREQRLSKDSLRLRNRALEASVNAIIITDTQGVIEYANPAFERITGYRVEDVLKRNFRFLQGDDTNQRGLATIRAAFRLRESCSALLRNYRKDGGLFWNDFHLAPVSNPEGTTTHFVGVLNDVTAIKAYEEKLERQANYDALTGLANKNVLRDRIQHAIASAQRHGTSLTIGFLDLDNFKFINDSLGHGVGDMLLKRVAERLEACLRGQDTVARYGGDEFAFVLVELASEESVSILMERLLKTVERPFEIDGHTFFISCSIGLCFYPRDGRDVDALLKNADAAMYRAKEAGRNNFQFYTPALQARITERLSMETRLHRALINEEFVLHYQPKVDLQSNRVIGVEALLRWEPPEQAAVHPQAFIPLAEETGLIVPMGEWVLETACIHNKRLQESGLPPISVAVNISARQCLHKSLTQAVTLALAQSGLEARYLELELTESLVMQNPEEIVRLLQELREMGLQLAIDDFGTGYSSLSYLQRFPLDRLKIDQSFVRDIGADPNDAAIARAVISLGHSLGLRVIAEGVSTQEQLAFLRRNGCNEMQGYLYSRPLPFEALQRLLQERTPGMFN